VLVRQQQLVDRPHRILQIVLSDHGAALTDRLGVERLLGPQQGLTERRRAAQTNRNIKE
jgi:hypothetical protein